MDARRMFSVFAIVFVAFAITETSFAEEPVHAAVIDTSALDGATLYKERTCIACHGADARTPILPEYPRLAGQSMAYAIQQMKDIKSGARANANTPAMRGVMHLVNEAEMEAIAEWLASLR